MKLKKLLWLGWNKNESGDTEFYNLNKLNSLENPFKNYKQAIKFLYAEINKKILLSVYEPNTFDWALFTLFNSKKFRNLTK